MTTKPIDAPSHLNAQQVAQLEKDIRAKLDSVVKDVELRKWAIERAFEKHDSLDACLTVAMQVYRFISFPLDEPMVAQKPAE